MDNVSPWVTIKVLAELHSFWRLQNPLPYVFHLFEAT